MWEEQRTPTSDDAYRALRVPPSERLGDRPAFYLSADHARRRPTISVGIARGLGRTAFYGLDFKSG
ncbi:hypothetical protein [Streptomyces bottropensis]|uniref:hypothetical protein n=1 Tax=Streptomyces bottropensis TaxID=42235 RepID=UPI0036A2F0CE